MIQEGDLFPNFSLRNQDDELVTLEDLKGGRTVVYFYPKDDTSGCTIEACEFRDAQVGPGGPRVIGVSPDSVKSHRKFASKYGLNFALLADEGHELADRLGLWVEKSLYGKKYMGVERTTFVLDPEGRIEKIYRKVKPQGHAPEVISALE